MIPAAADTISILGLGIVCRVGVPDDERAVPQRLEADLILRPLAGFGSLDDDLSRTVDYADVAARCRELATARPRQLIETLAEELAALLLASWPLAAVSVTIRKFILPDCAGVAVTLHRRRPS